MLQELRAASHLASIYLASGRCGAVRFGGLRCGAVRYGAVRCAGGLAGGWVGWADACAISLGILQYRSPGAFPPQFFSKT